MLKNPSLTTRIGVGKTIGFVFGLIGFFVLPHIMPAADGMLRWGILFWYPTLGAVIGVFGVYTQHPILKIALPWWVQAPALGAWMNFVLTLFAHDAIQSVMAVMFGPDGLISSPFWLVAEGAIIGLVIGFFATKFGGEGPATV